MYESKVRVSIFGLGYVGLATAVCLASRGFPVIGVDIDLKKVSAINNGECYIYEPGIEELIKEVREKGLLKATSNPTESILNTDFTFITVSTPTNPNGSVDLTAVEYATKSIATSLKGKKGYHLVVVKSTVPPGTTEGLVKKILEEFSEKRVGIDLGLCANPEFLREGRAIEDTFKPDRIVIGECDKRAGDVLERFYKEFYGDDMPPLLRTNAVNAELIKYVNNAFLAMKVSFINMVADLCQKIDGADVDIVAKGIGLDKRIGSLFLKAGAGWGGSCLPKDLEALKNLYSKYGERAPLIDATIEVNDHRPNKLIELAERITGGLNKKRVAILGLSFKPDTDDMRNAVSIKIINTLINKGAIVTVFDPKAMDNARRIFGERVNYSKDVIDCIKGAECAILVTEWSEFAKLKPEDFIKYMKDPCIVDGRRVFDPKEFLKKTKFATIGLKIDGL
ncbi:MAG: UDP-glucose/GDP-mannose dehydrogenase family protein [Nitrososphaerota archaeon]|nr:UDP-glucose/GDP-mannose dehydrogenase family protein [Nitrososphaerales archaeon]MDW8045190.1 UDP-glucose/GDP-mannose dehydrogenase family protein [Nitrososphaerota archaeon]